MDHLLGLKENVIIGKLIPAGSGLSIYRKYDKIEDECPCGCEHEHEHDHAAEAEAEPMEEAPAEDEILSITLEGEDESGEAD